MYFIMNIIIAGKKFFSTSYLLIVFSYVSVCVCVLCVLPGSFRGKGAFYFKIGGTFQLSSVCFKAGI